MKRSAQQQKEFVQLLQQHEKLVYKICALYAAGDEERKDLFQEIILQAWKSYAAFNGRAAISTWLYRVGLNTAINYRRKQKRSPELVYPEFLQHHPEEMPVGYREEYKLLQQLIAGLPDLDKALVLLYLDDNSYAEIADIMGISVSNVGARLSRIKEKLKQKAQPYIHS